MLAISHLHSLNVLYRDIKPHNVMIDGRGHLILIDFGLSKQEIIHPRGALSLVGTPDYSAPEVLKTGVQQIEAHNRERNHANNGGAGGKRSPNKGGGGNSSSSSRMPPKMGYGKAADWWSLGIMIYEMLSGTPTFRGADLRQTYQKYAPYIILFSAFFCDSNANFTLCFCAESCMRTWSSSLRSVSAWRHGCCCRG